MNAAADIRVMVCDDHPLFRRSLVMNLDDVDDIDVVAEAATGAEAVEFGAHVAPEVVLMDVHMPCTDGVTATRRLLEVVPTTRILMLTVDDDDDALLPALRAGAVGALRKAAVIDDTAAAVRAVAAGESMMPARLAARLVSEIADGHEDVFGVRLSSRELRILELLANGCGNDEIAVAESLPSRSVHNHVRNVLAKLHLNSRAEAVLYADREGLIGS